MRLSLGDRLEIRVGLEMGRSMTAIARGLGRAPSTVCREVNANGGRDEYRPAAARAQRCAGSWPDACAVARRLPDRFVGRIVDRVPLGDHVGHVVEVVEAQGTGAVGP